MASTDETSIVARAFVGRIGAILSCLGESRIGESHPRHPVGTNITLSLSEPIPLHIADRGQGRLAFDMQHVYVIVPPDPPGTDHPRVSTRMYEYRLLDVHERELLVYHWQPGADYAGPDQPHLHVSANLAAATSAVDQRTFGLDKVHLPTGRVALEAVVRSLITDFEVEPRRSNWTSLLNDGEEEFRAMAAQRP